MNAFDLARELGHEELIAIHDAASGLRVFIAIHDTTLGPAVGGTRMRPYASLDEAAIDALHLSRAMTYKAAMAEMPWGGAKAVIVGDPARDKTRALLVSYARALDRIGRFRTGGDMGIDGRDVALLARLTRFMSHPPSGAGVDASDLTAIGLAAAMRATAERLGLGLAGLSVALQGLGQVGYRLARRLAQAGARLTVADLDPGRAERAASELGVETVAPDGIYDVECDVFSPNAGGGILNDATLARLRCRAVVGGANEQLLEPRHGDALHERGIVYAPDYLVNAGGLLSLLFELGETDEAGIIARVEAIGPRLAALLARAQAEGVPSHRLADRIVEERLAAARAARKAAARPGAADDQPSTEAEVRP